jgi:hypothetical protein
MITLDQQEIDTFENAVQNLQNLQTFIKQLDSLKVKLEDYPQEAHIVDHGPILLEKPLAKVFDRIASFEHQCMVQVLDSLTVHIKPHINHIAKIDWSLAANASGMQFSPPPLEYITIICEYLMTLPGYFDRLAIKKDLEILCPRLPYILQSDIDNQQEEVDICHSWMCAVSRYTENLLFARYMKIKGLSDSQRLQLTSDMAYFYNILAALEIEPNAQFQKVVDLLELKDTEFEQETGNDNILAIVRLMRGNASNS